MCRSVSRIQPANGYRSLKVYLIAQTNPASRALDAAKDGAIIQASKHAAKPLRDAMKALWNAGGVRSLFAGMAS